MEKDKDFINAALADQRKSLNKIRTKTKEKELKEVTENQPISATVYREIIDGLLNSLDQLLEQNAETKKLLEDHHLTEIPAYGVALGQEGTYTAIKKRLLSDLEAAQQEANSFEGLDA